MLTKIKVKLKEDLHRLKNGNGEIDETTSMLKFSSSSIFDSSRCPQGESSHENSKDTKTFSITFAK